MQRSLFGGKNSVRFAASNVEILRHLSRITTPGREFIPQIDGLRFVAIITVIAYHIRMIGLFHLGHGPHEPVTDAVSYVFAAGHFGVMLFFTISGFVLSLPFARQYLAAGKKISLRDYFIRRITRIEPPYVIHLLILFLFCALLYRRMPLHLSWYGSESWLYYEATHLGSSLFYVNGLVFGTHPYPNPVLWSLEVEVQFYILAPFLAKVFTARNVLLRRGILAGAMVIMPLLVGPFSQHYIIWASLMGNLQYFLAGFLLADFYLSGELRPVTYAVFWDLIFLLTGCAVVWINFQNGLLSPLLLPWILLLCCLAAFLGQLTPAMLGNPWIITIGGMCYTIYLYHLIMISAFIQLTIHLQTNILWLDLLIQFFVMTPAILLVSAGLFALFERPFMRRDWPVRVLAVVLGKKTDKLKP